MAASEKTLTTHGALKNSLSVPTSNDSKYVDLNELLDLKLDAKTVKVSFTGDSNRLAIIKSTNRVDDSNSKDKIQRVQFPSAPKLPVVTRKCVNLECWRNDRPEGETDTETADSSEESRGNPENFTELCEEENGTPKDLGTDGDFAHTDAYLSGKSESDDEVSLVIADYRVREGTEDEAHYISTHEIEIAELDHDVDSDSVTPTNWDIDDDHQVYSFVDFASFDSDETISAQEESGAAEVRESAAVICSQAESDPADAKCATSDEKVSESQNQRASHIHLSIKATSRAINEPSNVQEKDGAIHHSINTGDTSHCVFRAAKGEKISDGAKCLIALPGRLHFGTKFKGKDVTEYSSGTSSAVSDLDDADKEVRNLTAKAFRSLAYPYLDAINFSTSSESSTSEHGRGMNRWSLVDLKYSNVNVSKAGNNNIVTHKSATSNFQLAKRRQSNGITGLTLTSRRAPPVEIFALNGSLMKARNASSTQKIELMGKFEQSQSGVIRLTETLNFRCNVKAATPANERHAKSSRGSRSADEVTNARSGAHNKPPCNPEEAMEDAHKKSIFASSLLKNVISKKMQFEQERKMERGEICEPCSAPMSCTPVHEHEPQPDRETVHRQTSKLSETGSDFTIVCLDELGDIMDSGSCDTKDEERLQETFALASDTNLDFTRSAAFDAKKGASEASRSALIRSQNSAFRSWRDDELDVQTERKNEQTSPDLTNSKLTKMSRLFVPNIQPASGERSPAKPEPSTNNDLVKGAMNNTLSVSDSGQSAGGSKSPEIKISLRSIRDTRSDPLSIAKLLTPSIGDQVKATDESKYQALTAALKSDSSDRIPQFTVRDVRDKGKVQAPIHQVRDVRKLVKSSYHFVSSDSNENKTNCADMEHKTSKQSLTRNPATLSPIVIKCQSVNTNSNVKQSAKSTETSKHRLTDDLPEVDESYPLVPTEGIKAGGTQINKPAGRLPLANINHEGPTGLRIEARTTARKQDKVEDPGEKKTDSKMVALEKLQAAVKTMEQLYVFDKNEWKRKSEPQPVTDSHVLSLLTREEHKVPEQELGSTASAFATMRQASYSNTDKMLPAGQQTQKEDKETFKTSHTPAIHEKRSGTKTLMHLGRTSKKTGLSHSQKVPVTTSSTKAPQVHGSSQVSFSSKAVPPKSPRLPVSLKVTKPKPVTEDKETLNSNEAGFTPVQFTSDSGNYITIPVKPHATPATQSHLKLSSNTKSHRDSNHSPKCSSIVMETRSPDTPTASIYHHPLPISMQAAQAQVICFSPTVQPSPVPTDHYHPTQRKMLLDPTTGNYYLVDTPVQPATKRLFDPETGQYVDVPMPQQPPMTPVPVPISPLAISPGGYGHTYMFYPGYMTTTVIPARTIQSQLSMQSEGEAGDKSLTGQQRDGTYMENPYYVPSGISLQSTQGAQHITTGKGANSKMPVISITSQQGPRIIAPPSFDGTTMSFVVEHQ